MAQYYKDLKPCILQDDKLHVLYPININYDNSNASIENTPHNSSDLNSPIYASNGTIWIDSSNNNSAGFINSSDSTIALKFKCPEFYPCLSYSDSTNTEEAKDAANFNVFSYEGMLSEHKYYSPHFKNSDHNAPAEFIDTETIDDKTFYKLSDDVKIYDSTYSSFYVDFSDGQVKAFYYPSELYKYFHQEESFDFAPYQINLDLGLNVMLKYIIDYSNFASTRFGDTLRYPGDQDKIYNTNKYYFTGCVKFAPLWFSSSLDNENLNTKSQYPKADDIVSYATYVYFLNNYSEWDHSIYSIPINQDNNIFLFRGYLGELLTGMFDYYCKYFPAGLVTMGCADQRYTEANFREDYDIPYSSMAVSDLGYNWVYNGICDEAVSMWVNPKETSAYGSQCDRIFTRDPKWISAPYYTGTGYRIPYYPLNSYIWSHKYLIPNNDDHLFREANHNNTLLENDDRNKVTLLISSKFIKYDVTTKSLYNSANCLNSIYWDKDENGMDIVVFKNNVEIFNRIYTDL